MRRIFVLCLVCLVVWSCATTGPGGKQSFILIPTGQEVEIGRGMAAEIDKTEKKLADSSWQKYLAEVGQKVVAVSDRKDLQYSFTVIESDQVNAFAGPGGFVYFYTGLLREMQSEGELAAVLAHEISHVVGRHSVKQIQTAMGAGLAYQLVFGDSDKKALSTAVAIGLNLAMSGYSRDAEREADRFGVEYMVKAGYDPQGMTAMFNTLARLGGGSGGSDIFESLSSTHPDTQERIANTKAQIANMGTLPAGLKVNKDRYQQMVKRLPPAARK